jgi:hypothetical protein
MLCVGTRRGSFADDVADGFFEICGVADFESTGDLECANSLEPAPSQTHEGGGGGGRRWRGDSSSGDDMEQDVTPDEQLAHRLWVQVLTVVFSSANVLADKAVLAANVRTARALGPLQSSFFDVIPETWIFPDERDRIILRAKSEGGAQSLWLYKPTRASPDALLRCPPRRRR